MNSQLGIDGQEQPERVCECGCGRSLDGKRPSAKYARDACRAAHWKERTGYGDDALRNGRNGDFWRGLADITRTRPARRAA